MMHWVTPQEMAELDRKTISSGIPGSVLMERAGTQVFHTARKMLRGERLPVLVLAGPGNNGGDGYVAARLLLEHGHPVSVHPAFPDPSNCAADCAANRASYLRAGGSESRTLPFPPGLIVDALLGNGFKGSLKGPVLEALEGNPLGGHPVLSVDIPTGVNGLTGEMDPSAVHAAVTVTFAAPKLGMLIPPGCGAVGALLVEDIGIPVPENSIREVMDFAAASSLLPRRPVDAHKGSFGRVLVLAGSEGMPGAALLAALGALRSGAGLVELCVPLPASQTIFGRIPEALCSYFLPGDVTSLPDPSRFSSVVTGPGLGDDAGTAKILQRILETWKIPLVLDADALNVLDPHMMGILSSRTNTVLTPHPGELARITGCSTELNSRFNAAAKLAATAGCPVLLKGRPSVVFRKDGGRTLNPSGNHGMATGGSGDVLSGLVAGFLAQGVAPADACALGAFTHGLAGDIATGSSSPRSLLPTDIARNIGRALAFMETPGHHHLLRLEGPWNGTLWNVPG